MSHVAPRSGGGGPSTVGGGRGRASVTARLDRIPVWPYERKLLWIVGAGYFFAFFDIVTISFATPVIATQFHASKTTVGCIRRRAHRRQVGTAAQPRDLGRGVLARHDLGRRQHERDGADRVSLHR